MPIPLELIKHNKNAINIHSCYFEESMSMEPLSAAAIATLVLTKLFETTGETLGENLMDQGGKLWQLLRRKSPKAVAALEPAEDKPLDYGQAVLEVEAAVKDDPEIGQAVQEVAKIFRAYCSKFCQVGRNN